MFSWERVYRINLYLSNDQREKFNHCDLFSRSLKASAGVYHIIYKFHMIINST